MATLKLNNGAIALKNGKASCVCCEEEELCLNVLDPGISEGFWGPIAKTPNISNSFASDLLNGRGFFKVTYQGQVTISENRQMFSSLFIPPTTYPCLRGSDNPVDGVILVGNGIILSPNNILFFAEIAHAESGAFLWIGLYWGGPIIVNQTGQNITIDQKTGQVTNEQFPQFPQNTTVSVFGFDLPAYAEEGAPAAPVIEYLASAP